jgi:hypothetical protein
MQAASGTVDCVEADWENPMSELKLPRFMTCIYQESVSARGKSNCAYSTKLLLVAMLVRRYDVR